MAASVCSSSFVVLQAVSLQAVQTAASPAQSQSTFVLGFKPLKRCTAAPRAVRRSQGASHRARLGVSCVQAAQATGAAKLDNSGDGIKYVNADEAKDLVEKQGYTIVDIRDEEQLKRAKITGSVHVPRWIPNNAMDPATIVLRQMHNNFAGFIYGIPYTKENPEFISTLQAKFPKNAKLLVVCQSGLRSASAVDMLEGLGYTSLATLVNGLDAATPGTFPKEGDRELNTAGKGGFMAIQGQFSIVLGALLIVAYLFFEVFPEVSKQTFGFSQIIP